jgi:PST family polysaccharide transporter
MLAVTLTTASLTLYRILSSFIIAKLVALYTGPTGIAMLGQLQSLLTALNGVVISPVGNGVVRYTAGNIGYGYEVCSNWWKASFLFSFFLMVIILPLGIIFSDNISYYLFDYSEYAWVVVICCLTLPLSVINTAFISVINGEQRYKRYVSVGFISVTISTLSVIFLVYNYKLHGALLAVAINTSIAGLVVFIISIKEPWVKIKYWFGLVGLKYFKDIGGYVLMAITAAIATPVALILVRNFLVDFTGWDSAGQWQAVWKISEVYLAVITMALSTFYLPQLSKLNDCLEIKKEVWNTAKVVLPIVIFLAMMVYLLRDFIINILFTKEFYAARSLFAVQLCGDVVKILAWLFAFPMLAKGAIKWFVFSEIFFATTLAFLSYLLIKNIGVHGANWAYLINYILYFFFVFFNLNRIVGISKLENER